MVARPEAQLGDALVAEGRVQLPQELRREQLELLGPDSGPARDRHDALALRHGLSLLADRLSHRLGPAALDAGQGGGRLEPRGHALDRERQGAGGAPPHAATVAPSCATVPSSTAVTQTSEPEAPGTWSASVVVISAWPPARTSSVSRSRRVESSSDITSSSSISGGLPRAPSTSRSANSSASSPTRCWPCDPSVRSGRPPCRSVR